MRSCVVAWMGDGYAGRVPAQPVSDREPTALRRFAVDLLDETDAIAVAQLAGGLTVKAKPDATLVTQVDMQVEVRLRERIREACPGHGIVGEEYENEAGDGA